MSLDFSLESLVFNTNSNVVPIATAVFFGYVTNILINARKTQPRAQQEERQKLEDYPGCGQRLADKYLWFQTQADECTWDCEWVDAPFISDPNFAGRSKNQRQETCFPNGLGGVDCSSEEGIGGSGNKAGFIKNDDLNIYFVFNLLRLPKDLRCLQTCGPIFHQFWKKSCVIKNGTIGAYYNNNVTQYKDSSGRDFYNCYMDKRKLSNREFKFVESNRQLEYHVTRDFQDLVFEICYLVYRFKDRIKVAGSPFGRNYGDCNDISNIYNSIYGNSIIPGLTRLEKENSKRKVSGKRKVEVKRRKNAKGKRKAEDKRKLEVKGKENRKRKKEVKRNKNDKMNRKVIRNVKSKKKNKQRTPPTSPNKKIGKKNPNSKRAPEPYLFINRTSDFRNNAGVRLSGPLGFINLYSQGFTSGYPWMCSLRSTGFRGRHKCGVTLLSGPPKDTILVGAAHCNYVCRNDMDVLLEMCCCGDNILNGCKSKSSYCPGNPKLQNARSQDLQIVCGEHNIGPLPEHISWENEIILDIQKIVNHENFKPGEPLEGNDIAVYLVDESQARKKMKMYPPFQARVDPVNTLSYAPFIDINGNFDNTKALQRNISSEEYKKIMLQSFRKVMIPACLPKEKYFPGKESAIFSAWKDPKPGYLSPLADFDNFKSDLLKDFDLSYEGKQPVNPPLEQLDVLNNLDITDYFNRHGAASLSFDMWPHHVRLDKHACKDPDWMESNTPYPAGTTCYKDPSARSCMLFGSSGSGLLKHFANEKITADQIKFNTSHGIMTLDQINLENKKYDAKDTVFETEKYGYVGPLSLYKGCDRAANINYKDVLKKDDTELNNIQFNNDFAKLEPQKWMMMYGGDNVAVFTDAFCYLDWIADQYNMDPPNGWKKPDYCFLPKGDRNDVNQTICRSAQNSTCNFWGNKKLQVKIGAYEANITMDRCYLLDVGGGYADNINMCVNQKGQLDHCANNCRGVDANSVVAGGITAIAVGTSAITSLLGPAAGVATLGIGGAATLGMGSAAMMMLDQRRRRRRCPPTRPCKDRVTGRCCRGFIRGGRRRCSRRC